MENLLNELNAETLAKVDALTNPLAKEVINRILEKTIVELTWMDSTFLRDALDIDLNRLALYLK